MHTRRTRMYTQQEELRTYTQKYIISCLPSFCGPGRDRRRAVFLPRLFVCSFFYQKNAILPFLDKFAFLEQIRAPAYNHIHTHPTTSTHTHTTTTTTHTHTPSPLNTTTHTPPVAYSNHSIRSYFVLFTFSSAFLHYKLIQLCRSNKMSADGEAPSSMEVVRAKRPDVTARHNRRKELVEQCVKCSLPGRLAPVWSESRPRRP